MASPDLEYIDISDFRPGIYERVSPQNPPGAATPDGTFRCFADQSGALVPAPRLVDTITSPAFQTDPEEDIIYIGGIMAADPVFDDNTPTGIDQSNTALFVGFEYFDAPTNRRYTVRRYRRHSTEIWDTIRSHSDPFSPGLDTDEYKPFQCWMYRTRSRRDSPNNAGRSIIAITYGEELYTFPDDQTPAVHSYYDMDTPPPGVPQPERIVAHQGRVVVFPLSLNSFGDANYVWAHNELMYWFAVNDVGTMDTDSFFNVVFGYENPSGYEGVASLTANELFLLKRRGGALLLRGDLNDPTAITLPNVLAPGFSNNQGIHSPIGFVYCVDNNTVWVWKGGDTSENLAPQMLNNFWRPDGTGPLDVGAKYRAHTTNALWSRFIVLPRNWFYDIDQQGWWLLDDPTVRQGYHLDSDWTQRWLWMTPYAMDYNAGGNMPVAYEYDRSRGANSYQWQGHPVQMSMDRNVECRQVVLVASGHGTVQVTVEGRGGNQGTVPFTIDSDFPIAIRKQIHASGYNLQPTVVSTADGEAGDAGAPVVHNLRLGVAERQRVSRDV